MPEGAWIGAPGSRGRAVAVGLALLLAVALSLVQMRLIPWKVPRRNNDLIPISEGVKAVLFLLAASNVGVPLAIVLELARGASQYFFVLPMVSLMLLPAATALWLILTGYPNVFEQADGMEGR